MSVNPFLLDTAVPLFGLSDPSPSLVGSKWAIVSEGPRRGHRSPGGVPLLNSCSFALSAANSGDVAAIGFVSNVLTIFPEPFCEALLSRYVEHPFAGLLLEQGDGPGVRPDRPLSSDERPASQSKYASILGYEGSSALSLRRECTHRTAPGQ